MCVVKMIRVDAHITALWIAIVKRIAQLVVGIPVVMHVVWRLCACWHGAVYWLEGDMWMRRDLNVNLHLP